MNTYLFLAFVMLSFRYVYEYSNSFVELKRKVEML